MRRAAPKKLTQANAEKQGYVANSGYSALILLRYPSKKPPPRGDRGPGHRPSIAAG